MTIYPVPKPVRAKRTRAPLRNKKRMKARNAKRKGSSFPGMRHEDFTHWLTTENNCMLRMRAIAGRFSLNDVAVMASDSSGKVWGEWLHLCWSDQDRPPIDPAHVGKHRSKGAPDFGHTVPLCHAAHAFYDAHRSDWKRMTGYSERKMASAASGYALKYVESGGSSTPQGAT